MLGADGTGLREGIVADAMLSEAEGASVAATPGATIYKGMTLNLADIQLGLLQNRIV